MQIGDVYSTWACSKLLTELTGFKPKTNVNDGVKEFIKWFRHYYQI